MARKLLYGVRILPGEKFVKSYYELVLCYCTDRICYTGRNKGVPEPAYIGSARPVLTNSKLLKRCPGSKPLSGQMLQSMYTHAHQQNKLQVSFLF